MATETKPNHPSVKQPDEPLIGHRHDDPKSQGAAGSGAESEKESAQKAATPDQLTAAVLYLASRIGGAAVDGIAFILEPPEKQSGKGVTSPKQSDV